MKRPLLVRFKYAQGINNNILVRVIRLLTLLLYQSISLTLFSSLSIRQYTLACIIVYGLLLWIFYYYYYIYLGHFLVCCQSIMYFFGLVIGICNTCFVLQVFVLF